MAVQMTVLAINAYLLAWALLKKPRDPAHWAFAALGASLVIWNAGALLHGFAGDDFAAGGRLAAAALRLSFVGAALAPANMLFLSFLAGEEKRLPRPKPGVWIWLTYLPAAGLGALVRLAPPSPAAAANPWRRTFYDTSHAGAYGTAALVTLYLLAALAMAWPDGRISERSRRQAEILFRGAVAPFAAGVVFILAIGLIRPDRAPTTALWMMILSQVAMFQLVRLGWVKLKLTREKGVMFFLVFVMAAACVLLAFVVAWWLFERSLSIETALVLTATLVAFCFVVAAAMPRLEALAQRFVRHRPPGGRTQP